MHQNVPRRTVIYAKDIQRITGRRIRTARKMLADIRKRYNKQRTDFVTVREFCSFTGIPEEDVRPYLVD